ncbi:hypothetical protein NIES4074_37790 [Cylindrospermum sp. NIES-4074]|nr:hypothetical protein NIES4074_37790 [Cylindrospermum sp. NIES-4074]
MMRINVNHSQINPAHPLILISITFFLIPEIYSRLTSNLGKWSVANKKQLTTIATFSVVRTVLIPQSPEATRFILSTG